MGVVSRDRREGGNHLPATVMLRGPTLELAVKLTTLRPKAMTALIARATALRGVISCAPKTRTRASSPER